MNCDTCSVGFPSRPYVVFLILMHPFAALDASDELDEDSGVLLHEDDDEEDCGTFLKFLNSIAAHVSLASTCTFPSCGVTIHFVQPYKSSSVTIFSPGVTELKIAMPPVLLWVEASVPLRRNVKGGSGLMEFPSRIPTLVITIHPFVATLEELLELCGWSDSLSS